MPVHAFTVYDMIERGAIVHGAQPAIIHGDNTVTYAQFRQKVDSLAAGLAAKGITRRDRICILAQNDPAYLDLYGACAKLGAIAYPINWRLTAEEVARVVERADPRMFVTDAASLPLVAGWPAAKKEVSLWYQFGAAPGAGYTSFDKLYGDASQAPSPDVSADDPFAVISTAAVDVVPRGAVLTHGNVLTANMLVASQMHYSAADRYLLALPLFHITALGNALATLHTGGANVLVSKYDPDEAVKLVDKHKISHVSDFPPVLTTLLDAAEKAGSKLASLRIVSGLDAPATIQRLHEKTGAKFWTGFGQSETSGFVTLQAVADHPGTSGKPVPGCRVKCVDDADQEVPLGTPGEIVVRGPLVFQGYFDQPDVTGFTLRNGWHHTGDVGKFDADGYLTYVKRKPEKELIKPGGENVYPAEVETVILQLSGVSGVCVYGVPDPQWGEAVKAVVEVKGNNPYSPEQVIDHVGGKIARFKRPKVVVFTDALPRGTDSAVDREAVKAKWGNAQ